MDEPVLWAGIVLLAGALGALALRAGGLAAGAGALAGGFVLLAALRSAGAIDRPADLTSIGDVLTALIGLHLGAAIDARWLSRRIGPLALRTAAGAAAVAALVTLAGAALGFGWGVSAALGAGCSALSPAAVAAVTSETRARGEVSGRLMVASPVSLLLAIVAVGLLAGPSGAPSLAVALLAALAGGILCGLILMLSLSRLRTRGAILACAGGGALLIAALSWRLPVPGGAGLAPAAIVAGIVASSFVPNRALIRDALGDVAWPGAMALLSVAGGRVLHETILAWLPAAVLLAAARVAGLALAGWRDGAGFALRQAAAQAPMAGPSMGGLAALLAAGSARGSAEAASLLVAAGFVSEVAGMISMRSALARAGETASLEVDPDAWRAPMR